MDLDDESSTSEINILADGRICVFGTSLPILEMLDAVPLGDPALGRRIEALRKVQVRQSPQSSGGLSAENEKTIDESRRTLSP